MNADQAPKAPVSESPATVANPGQGLGIASVILAVLGVGLIGLILGIVGFNKSKKAGQKNTVAVVGIVLSILSIIAVTIVLFTVIGAVALLANTCAELGPGTHFVNGVTYTCS